MWFPAARKPRGNSDPCLHWTVQIPLLALSVTSRSSVQAPASAPVPGRELRAPLPCQSHLRAPLAQTKDLYPERALKIIVQRDLGEEPLSGMQFPAVQAPPAATLCCLGWVSGSCLRLSWGRTGSRATLLQSQPPSALLGHPGELSLPVMG